MLLFIRCILLAVLVCFTPMAASGSSKTILVLHSYHQGYEWTDAVNEGISSILGGIPDYEIAYEYLDSQRAPPGAMEAMATMLGSRYINRQPEVIIAVDDDALRFLLANRDSLFTDIPITFCGINDISSYDTTTFLRITGVTEAPDILGSLQFALQLFPKTKTILVIADNTTSGVINLKRFERAVTNLPSSISVSTLIAPEPDVAERTLGTLLPGSIVMYLSYLRTDSGVRMTVKESVGFVARVSPVPVFGCWDFIIDAGAFGGKVVSGRLQGVASAQQAQYILEGIPPSSIPITAPESYERVIAFNQAGRFKLNLSSLPDGVIMLGKPAPLPMMAQVGIGVLTFVILLEALTIFIALRRRKMLIIAESRYRTLAEQLPAIVYSLELDPEIKTTYVSPQLRDILGYDPQTWIQDSSSWLQSVYSEDRARLIEETGKANEKRKPVVFEYRAVSATGQVKYIKNRRAYYTDAGDKHAAIGVWTDVTDEYKAQEFLKAALSEKELLLKEIHHRVKNNFQIISSLLHLESERVPEGPAATALFETERRIFAMSLVHENLYRSGDFGSIDFKPYAYRMGEELRSFALHTKEIGFEVTGNELLLGLDQAVPLGLLLNEALMNAYKHAFPDGFPGKGVITVRIRSGKENWEVAICDNGAGLPRESLVEKSKSEKTQASLGMTLMKLLAEQIGGKFSIQSDNGTIVSITVPVNPI